MADRATTAVALMALSLVVAGCDATTDADDPITAPSAAPTAPPVGVVPAGFELTFATLEGPGADGISLALWYAETPDQWHRGLTGVTDLGEADGMLFEFDGEAVYGFHMWQTPMPLDIYFFDAAGRFVGRRQMDPCLDTTSSACERYSPDMPFVSAIEVPAGSLADADVDERWTIGYGPQLDQQTSTVAG